MDKKTVLLTGGTGFVGRQIGKALLSNGHRLKIVSRPGGQERFQPPSGAIDWIDTDDLFSESVDWWAETLFDVDVVIHSAWYVEPGKYLDSTRNLDCVRGGLVMAEAAAKLGLAHFIGIGTCFEYALPNTEITAQSPLGPVTLYAAAKLALFHMLERRFAGSGVSLTWARLFYLFGEGEHPARLFPTLHRKFAAGEPMAMSSGDKIRDFMDVAEAGRLIALLADNGQTGVVNVCSGRPVTLRAVAEDIADQYGRRDLLSFGQAVVHPRDPEGVAGVCNMRLADMEKARW